MLYRTCGVYVGLITSLGLFTGIALADPQPLPSSVLNGNGVQLDTSVNVPSGNPTYKVGFGSYAGGGFTATIDGVNTVLWCVDAEEDIAPPTTYNADLVEVSQIGSNLSDVRYDNATSTQWKNSLGSATVQQRYEMAAYLTSLYPGVTSTDPAGPTQPATLQDQELQTAIWEILWNSSVSAQGGISYSEIASGNGTFNTADKNAVTTDIASAEAFANNSANASFFNNYAVVSGGVNSSGTLQSPGVQTYIVPLDTPSAVPEPASVVLLGSLLAGVFALTRRARAKRVHSMC